MFLDIKQLTLYVRFKKFSAFSFVVSCFSNRYIYIYIYIIGFSALSKTNGVCLDNVLK